MKILMCWFWIFLPIMEACRHLLVKISIFQLYTCLNNDTIIICSINRKKKYQRTRQYPISIKLYKEHPFILILKWTLLIWSLFIIIWFSFRFILLLFVRVHNIIKLLDWFYTNEFIRRWKSWIWDDKPYYHTNYTVYDCKFKFSKD